MNAARIAREKDEALRARVLIEITFDLDAAWGQAYATLEEFPRVGEMSALAEAIMDGKIRNVRVAL